MHLSAEFVRMLIDGVWTKHVPVDLTIFIFVEIDLEHVLAKTSAGMDNPEMGDSTGESHSPPVPVTGVVLRILEVTTVGRSERVNGLR